MKASSNPFGRFGTDTIDTNAAAAGDDGMPFWTCAKKWMGPQMG